MGKNFFLQEPSAFYSPNNQGEQFTDLTRTNQMLSDTYLGNYLDKATSLQNSINPYSGSFFGNDEFGQNVSSFQNNYQNNNVMSRDSTQAYSGLPQNSGTVVNGTQGPLAAPNSSVVTNGNFADSRGFQQFGGSESDWMTLSGEERLNFDKIAGNNETNWADMGGLAAQGLGSLTGVMSYFDNKSLRDKQIEGLDTNIAIAKDEQAHRKNFRTKTASAFA